MTKLKGKICSLVLTLVCVCFTLVVSAIDYTSSDPNKNSTYDRGSAADFAINNTYSPYSGMSYVIPNEDCTNFVSHCLKAGGMPTIPCANYNDYKGWNYYNGSWENAHLFRYHWGNVNGVGYNTCYSYKTYTIGHALDTNNWNTIYNDLYRGDVVQFVFGADSPFISKHYIGETGHSQIVHGYTSTTINGITYPDFYTAQHSVDRNYQSLAYYIKYTAPANWGSQGWVCTYKIKR
jgi:hypothetical protein